MAAVPLVVGAAPPHAAPTIYPGGHTMYDPLNARVDVNIAIPFPVAPNIRRIAAVPNIVAGNSLYLPFVPDEITSIRLPVPAPPGIAFFYTDELDGCMIFVDQAVAGGDIIVYHANTGAHPPGVNAWADLQLPGATGILNGLHATARGHYGIVAPAASAVVGKPRYFLSAGNEERRKNGQHRRGIHRARPSFGGGCTVFGFPGGPHGWTLHFQTWGDVEYRRPIFSPTRHRPGGPGALHQIDMGTTVVFELHGFF